MLHLFVSPISGLAVNERIHGADNNTVSRLVTDFI